MVDLAALKRDLEAAGITPLEFSSPEYGSYLYVDDLHSGEIDVYADEVRICDSPVNWPALDIIRKHVAPAPAITPDQIAATFRHGELAWYWEHAPHIAVQCAAYDDQNERERAASLAGAAAVLGLLGVNDFLTPSKSIPLDTEHKPVLDGEPPTE